jgi:hypothetical protein
MPQHHQLTFNLRKLGPGGGRSLNDVADECCVNPRTLRKWDAGAAAAPDSVVKLVAYVVGLDQLEAAEADGPEALRAALGGDVTVARVKDYLESLFAKHDPLNHR